MMISLCNDHCFSIEFNRIVLYVMYIILKLHNQKHVISIFFKFILQYPNVSDIFVLNNSYFPTIEELRMNHREFCN